jgi:hypothetical protein
MDTSEREAERRFKGIVREFVLEMSRRGASPKRTLLLTHDPGIASGMSYSAMIVVPASVFRGVRERAEAGAITEGAARVLRQSAFDRPWFDIELDMTDDRILFRLGKIHDVREAEA